MDLKALREQLDQRSAEYSVLFEDDLMMGRRSTIEGLEVIEYHMRPLAVQRIFGLHEAEIRKALAGLYCYSPRPTDSDIQFYFRKHISSREELITVVLKRRYPQEV